MRDLQGVIISTKKNIAYRGGYLSEVASIQDTDEKLQGLGLYCLGAAVRMAV